MSRILSELATDTTDQAAGADDDDIQISAVLDCLDDETCLAILDELEAFDTAMTAQELSNACDISLTSTYRKLDRLAEGGMVGQHAEVDQDGHRRTRYFRLVDEIQISLNAETPLEVRLYNDPIRLAGAEQ